MSQSYSDNYAKLSAQFEGLEHATWNTYGLYILDYPASLHILKKL